MSRYPLYARSSSVSRITRPISEIADGGRNYQSQRFNHSSANPNLSKLDFQNKSIISHKLPLRIDQSGIYMKPISKSALETETKVTLYSEVERLSILNYELKVQNEELTTQVDKLKDKFKKVGDYKTRVYDIERDGERKEIALNNLAKENETLRADNRNLSKLEPAFQDVIDQNKLLATEIQKLQDENEMLAQTKNQLQLDMNQIDHQNQSTKLALDNLGNELSQRNREVDHFNQQIAQQQSKIDELIFENSKLESVIVETTAQVDTLHRRLSQNEQAKDEKIGLMKKQFDIEKDGLMRNQIAKMNDEKQIEKAKFDSILDEVKRQRDELANKLNLVVADNENLTQESRTKQSEIDSQRMTSLLQEQKIEDLKHAYEHEKVAAREELQHSQEQEISRIKFQHENIVKEMTKDFEGKASELLKQIGELKALEEVITDKDRHIQTLKAEIVANERLMQGKMQQNIEREVSIVESAKQQEIQECKIQMQLGDKKVQELETKISLLTMEVERLSTLTEEKSKENKDLAIQTQKIKDQFSKDLEEQRFMLISERDNDVELMRSSLKKRHLTEIEPMRERNGELEQKLFELVAENDRLSQQIIEKNENIHSYKQEAHLLEDRFRNQMQDLERIHQTTITATVDKEIKLVSMKHDQELEELEKQIAMLTQEVTTLQTKNSFLIKEGEKLREHIDQYRNQVDELQSLTTEIELKKNKEISNIRDQFENYQKSHREASQIAIKYEAEKSSLNSRIHQLEGKIEELQKKTSLLLVDNEKVRDLCNEKAADLDQQRRRNQDERQSFEAQKTVLENKLENTKKQGMEAREHLIKLSTEKQNCESQLKTLKSVNESLKSELENVYELMDQRKKEQETHSSIMDELRVQSESLSKKLIEQQNDTLASKDKSDIMLRRVEDLEQERDLYKERADRLNMELTRLSLELDTKIREMDILSAKYQKSLDLQSSQLKGQFDSLGRE